MFINLKIFCTFLIIQSKLLLIIILKMQEEDCKTKDDLNNKSASKKEISILLKSKRKMFHDYINISIHTSNNSK